MEFGRIGGQGSQRVPGLCITAMQFFNRIFWAKTTRVMALQAAYRDGQRIWNIVETLRTDDRGDYGLFWLPPGRYFIAVQPVEPRLGGFAQQLLPPGRSVFREDGGTRLTIRRTLDDGQVVEETRTVAFYWRYERGAPTSHRPSRCRMGRA